MKITSATFLIVILSIFLHSSSIYAKQVCNTIKQWECSYSSDSYGSCEWVDRDSCYIEGKTTLPPNQPAPPQKCGEVSVSYQVHAKNAGWLGYTCNGSQAGTTGQSRRVEAIQLKTTGLPNGCLLKYQVHAKEKGWLSAREGEQAGTTGQSRRIEAIKAHLGGCKKYGVKYRVHAKDKGWMNWVQDGEQAGTTGQSRRIEAIEIKLFEK